MQVQKLCEYLYINCQAHDYHTESKFFPGFMMGNNGDGGDMSNSVEIPYMTFVISLAVTIKCYMVKWARENYYHDLGSPYNLRLASGDTNGVVIVWDVASGEAKSEFSDGTKPIQDLEWLVTQDASHDLLIVLHPPYSLILWNADTGTKLWKKSYTESLISFSFDPFNPRHVASSNLKSDGSNNSLDRKSSSKNLAKRMSKILVGEGPTKKSADEDSVSVNECLQLSYHRACRHHLILVYPREILLLDLEINQTVGIISMERSGSPFVQVLPLRQRDALLCLHENGSISARVRRKTNVLSTPASEGTGAFDDSPPQMSLDVMYDLRCQSDALRVTRHSKVAAISTCPVSEKSFALIMTDSRVMFWELMTVEPQGPRLSPVNPTGSLLPLKAAIQNQSINLPIISDVMPPKNTLSDLICPSQHISSDNKVLHKGNTNGGLRFLLTGLLNGILNSITTVRMCPPLTTKNWSIYEPLIAIGNNTGVIQVLNIASGEITREYGIHTGPVRGIEWSSLRSFLSFSYPNPGPSGLVKNDVVFVDICSGKTTPLRTNRDHESPIELLRISHLKQYFLLAFKEKPVELWDLRTFTMLREMGKSLPRPTALEWSPSHSLKSLKKKSQQQSSDSVTTSITSQNAQDNMASSTTSIHENTESDPKSSPKTAIKEHFVFTDAEGTLYHFVSGMGTITWVGWKGDNILFGDVDGQLCVWDLRSKTSRTLSTHRGWIKKIRFAPGRGNLKFSILYVDGVDIWDIKEGKPELVSSLKSPREITKILDTDWCGSDRPVLATVDCCIHVSDLTLKKYVSPIEDKDLSGPVFCPHLVPSRGSLLMKYMLQHQPWNEQYQTKLDSLREEDKSVQEIVNSQMELIDRLFGDESEGDMYIPPLPGYKEANDLVVLDNPEDGETQKEVIKELFKDPSLERCYDTVCDSHSFQKYELDRVALHDSKRATYEHTKKCAENYIMLGQTDRAVQLLLETEPDNDSYYTDSLRACLVASIRSSGVSQSTIKLVATNLIANGKLAEGVQLLCLIDKGMDACRYLQTYGAWDQAVWLAKATLQYSDCCEVMKRWTDHLCSTNVNQKSKAVLVMLSLGQFTKVLEMLYVGIVEAIFLEYARLLANIGHKQAAECYCGKAGGKGEQFLKEVNILFS
ncbi:hypothetical protein KUTeg_004801 [Tegillarca granosa]|uniref:WD repeat-containing protein 11 n=1 Tax=Tegillarca granosa TaxID=220873 RepID=A0ABQ9FHW7_TEGGR|nr:hypothetical protein KUTeg_004801 [Tegillarca granosa]